MLRDMAWPNYHDPGGPPTLTILKLKFQANHQPSGESRIYMITAVFDLNLRDNLGIKPTHNSLLAFAVFSTY